MFNTAMLLPIDIVISSLIVMALLFSSSRKKMGSILLASLIVIFLYLHFLAFVYTSDDVKLKAETFGTFRPLGYLIGPLIYFYILSVTTTDLRLRWRDGLHLIPSFIALLTTLPLFFMDSDNKYLLSQLAIERGSIQLRFSIFVGVCLVYLIFSYRQIGKFEQKIKQQYSSMQLWKIGWLRACLLATVVVWGCCLIFSIFGLTSDNLKYVSLAQVFASYLIAFTAIRRSLLFSKEKLELTALPDTENLAGLSQKEILVKYGWHPADFEFKKEKIAQVMRDEKLYKNNKFRLRDFAVAVDIPEYQVSQLINIGYKMNFFDFVNGYRIKEAQELLQNSSKRNLNIIEVAYEVGFNSKSTFNTAFKKFVGKTPTEVRAQS